MDTCLIRADAGTNIGFGHIMRCMTLANTLDMQCVFVSRHLPRSLYALLIDHGHAVIKLPESPVLPDKNQGLYGEWLGTTETHDAMDFIDATQQFQARWIICDHYALGHEWERYISQNHKSRIMAIDDLNRQHSCDILLDTTFDKTDADYTESSKPCVTLIGAKYALLRPQFADERPKVLKLRDQDYAMQRPVQNALISLGGIDKDNATSHILDAFTKIPNIDQITTHVLLGSEAPHLETLKAYEDTAFHPVKVHVGLSNVASLLSNMDICVGASGSSTWERCSLGLPTINILLAENQRTIIDNLANSGAVIDGGDQHNFNAASFAQDILWPLISQPELRHKLSQTCRDICDGHGAQRVASLLN